MDVFQYRSQISIIRISISISPKLVAESSERREADEVERSCTECSPSRLMQMVKAAARAPANNERSGMHGIDLNPWTSDESFFHLLFFILYHHLFLFQNMFSKQFF